MTTVSEFSVSFWVIYETRQKLLDLIEPEVVPPNSKFIKGNLLDRDQLSDAMIDCELVYHTASAGMSGAGQLCEKVCKKVNVDGTQ